jgi:hypothetical protein
MLSAITTSVKHGCCRSVFVVRTGIAMLLLTVGTIASAVEVYLLPVAPVGKETDSVPATMKLVRTSSIGTLDVRLSLNADSTAVLITDYTVGGVVDPNFLTPDPLDPVTDPNTTLVSFLDGENERVITITPVDDALVEARESAVFTVKPIGLTYVIGAPSSMSATIADNDHRARIQVPDPIADEDSALFGLVSDPIIQRRAVMRVRFDEFAPGNEFTRNLAVQFVTSGGTRPIADLGTDYQVHFKICGNDSGGATEERSRIGYDKVNILGTGLGYTLIAHLAGENEIDISGDGLGIAAGSTIRFNNHAQVYPVLTSGNNGIVLGQLVTRAGTVAVAIGSSTITGTASLFSTQLAVGDFIWVNNERKQILSIASDTSLTVTTSFAAAATGVPLRSEVAFPLVANLPNGTEINVLSGSGGGTTDFPDVVDHVYPAGSNTIKVDFGAGGLFEGDVFQLDGHDGFYVVTAVSAALSNSPAGSSGTVTLRRFEGAGAGDGLEVDTGGSPLLTTHIAATISGGVMQVLIPEESTKVEISISPGANGDGAEGAEEVRMRMIADEDYEILTPQESSIIIADRDVATSISVQSNAGLPSQTGFFQLTLSQPFSRAISVPYLVDDTFAISPGPLSNDDYVETILPSVTFVAGQTQALIQVDPINRGPTSVTLTLIPTFDYKLSGSSSSGVNPSATMDIANSIGAVSIAASIPSANESATAPVNGRFTVSITRNSSQTGAVGITLDISGTAVFGSRYEFVNPTNVLIPVTNDQIQVVIPANQNSTTVGVRPINNFLADGDQIVQLQVVDGQSYLVGAPSTASVTVDDDEPTISVARVGDAARPSTPGSFVFSYAGAALSQAVVVNFTYSGTAVRNTDFTGATSVTIPSGNISQTLSINPIDTPAGTAATVAVTITPSTTYTIGTNTASLSILASDAPQSNKPTPGSISSGASSGGCGLGSGLATLAGLGLFALLAFRRRES